MAIEDSKQKALTVKQIYSWIQTQFPYYSKTENGWKNSVRHNLSIHQAFYKIRQPTDCAAVPEKAFLGSAGKGCVWKVNPSYRLGLLPTMCAESDLQQTLQKGSHKVASKPRAKAARLMKRAKTLLDVDMKHSAKSDIQLRWDSTADMFGSRPSSDSGGLRLPDCSLWSVAFVIYELRETLNHLAGPEFTR